MSKKQLEETTTWRCDTCGQKIKSAKDGWVEWLHFFPATSSGPKGRGLRLVHNGGTSPRGISGCQYGKGARNPNEMVNDLQLEEFLGADGLMHLLELIYDQKVPTEEVLEMIKRLHIPGYEEARLHFKSAISAGEYEPNTAPGFPFQSQIAGVLEFARRRQSDE
ncbi:hypothetical protein KYC5002_36940 [Archangium violaceum]|uniref:hypothetical protein n=1 Tax=Archangium violaceum TaxID=83451 RepID=UPI002B2EAFE6|nr:hypothetical protein KYC5002_36940 [Archangium gephyra]